MAKHKWDETQKENVEAGATRRFCCPTCQVEFEVTYEPKSLKCEKSRKQIKPKDIVCCPFCTSDVDAEDVT